MQAAGGRCNTSERTNSSSAGPAPSRCISTPSSSFSTQPASVLAWARRNTNGRKPTPCTTPRTRISQALVIGSYPDPAAAAMPADLHHIAVLRQDRHGALSAGNGDHAGARVLVHIHVVFDVVMPLP